MKKFENLRAYLRAIRDLTEVRFLIDSHPVGELILSDKFAEAFSQAFKVWYEARTYKVLCPPGEDNAYPGDRAAFSLALKSTFYQFRYAWPKATIDRALEALARSLPDVEEVDSYEETQPFVQSMRARTAGLDASNPLGGLRSVLEQLLGGQEGIKAGTPTPGCDCPRCTAIRAGGATDGEAPATEDQNPGTKGMPPELRQLLERLGSLRNAPSPRDQIIQQATDPGSPEESHYNRVLEASREQINA